MSLRGERTLLERRVSAEVREGTPVITYSDYLLFPGRALWSPRDTVRAQDGLRRWNKVMSWSDRLLLS